MAHEARIEDLTATQAAEVESEWRQLGATRIRRIAQADGLFTMVCVFPGSPFATADEREAMQPTPPSPPQPIPAVSTTLDFGDLAAEYLAQFDACVPDADKQPLIAAQLRKIRPGEMRYRALGDRLGIPWFFVAIVHSLESGSDFRLHLHNGDPLSQRTQQVPKGRPLAGDPPFTWEESADDALRMKGLVGQADWSVATMLFRWESFNGFGYRVRGLATPYLWSFSSIYTGGLFVADHVFDANARSKQCGAAVLLKQLQAQAVL
jgi:lysozyme family protein